MFSQPRAVAVRRIRSEELPFQNHTVECDLQEINALHRDRDCQPHRVALLPHTTQTKNAVFKRVVHTTRHILHT